MSTIDARHARLAARTAKEHARTAERKRDARQRAKSAARRKVERAAKRRMSNDDHRAAWEQWMADIRAGRDVPDPFA